MAKEKCLISIDPGWKNLGLTQWWVDDVGWKFANSFLRVYRDRDPNETFEQYKSEGLKRAWMFAHHQFDPRVVTDVVVERMPFHGASTQRILTLMMLGIFEVVCATKEIQWHEISASEVKKSLTGDGKATKARMRRAILDEYPQALMERKVTEVSFDEADSIAVGDTFLKDRYGKGNAKAQDS